MEIAPICKVSFSTNHPGDVVHKCAAFAARVSDFSKNSHRVKYNRVVLTLIHCLPVLDRPDTCHTQEAKLPLPTPYCITCRYYLKSHPNHLVNSVKDFVAYYCAVRTSQKNPSTCFWVKHSWKRLILYVAWFARNSEHCIAMGWLYLAVSHILGFCELSDYVYMYVFYGLSLAGLRWDTMSCYFTGMT